MSIGSEVTKISSGVSKGVDSAVGEFCGGWTNNVVRGFIKGVYKFMSSGEEDKSMRIMARRFTEASAKQTQDINWFFNSVGGISNPNTAEKGIGAITKALPNITQINAVRVDDWSKILPNRARWFEITPLGTGEEWIVRGIVVMVIFFVWLKMREDRKEEDAVKRNKEIARDKAEMELLKIKWETDLLKQQMGGK